MTPFFSIIVVCLNPGEKLLQTLQSIQKQEFRDYEIVLKDGGSTDGSLQKLDPEQSGLHVVTKPDRGIYDAMNQAIYEGSGHQLKVEAPFVNLTKADVVKKGLELNVPYELTWSCYEGGEKPCGKCGTCIDRAKAFAANGVADPAL